MEKLNQRVRRPPEMNQTAVYMANSAATLSLSDGADQRRPESRRRGLLEHGQKLFIHEGFVRSWCCGLWRARLECTHVSAVEGVCHLDDQRSHVGGHSHLHKCSAELFVGCLRVGKVGLTDGFSNDASRLRHIDVMLSLKFASLFPGEILG